MTNQFLSAKLVDQLKIAVDKEKEEYLAADDPSKPSGYAILCMKDGHVSLTRKEYMHQLSDPDARWSCPVCRSTHVHLVEPEEESDG